MSEQNACIDNLDPYLQYNRFNPFFSGLCRNCQHSNLDHMNYQYGVSYQEWGIGRGCDLVGCPCREFQE